MTDHSPAAARSRSRLVLLRRLARRVEEIVLTVAAAFVAVFTIVVLYVVVGRYVFGSTPYWSEEVPRSLLVWSVFLGVVPVTVRWTHLSAGLLPLMTREGPIRRALAWGARVATAVFFLLLGFAGIEHTQAGMNSLTTALQIPSSAVYAALPCGSLLAALAALVPPAEEHAP